MKWGFVVNKLIINFVFNLLWVAKGMFSLLMKLALVALSGALLMAVFASDPRMSAIGWSVVFLMFSVVLLGVAWYYDSSMKKFYSRNS